MQCESNASIDRDLIKRVRGFLTRQHLPSLRSIEVDAAAGVVTISGRVKSFYERQLCIHCCQRVAGVVKLNDRVEVDHEPKAQRPNLALPFARPALAG